MNDRSSQFPPLVLVNAEAGGNKVTELERVPLRSSEDGEGYDEAFIQHLFFDCPAALPIAEIDSAFGDLIPVCTELRSAAGYIDGVFVNTDGMLTLAEFKLWRNPEMRREVIGQILDYAKDLARWDYTDLQREVSNRLGRPGNALFELAQAKAPGLSEAKFADDVTRNLRRGRFLLLIIGDGIREGVESIVDFLQQYTGLQFTMALIEAAVYKLPSAETLIQPRILARTVIVNRTVVELVGENVRARHEVAEEAELSETGETNLRFWEALLSGLSLQDAAQKLPEPTTHSNLFFMFGFTSEIWITAFISRSDRKYGVFVSRSTGSTFGEEAFGHLMDNLKDLQQECGDDLATWVNRQGLPRIGFSHTADFLADPNKVQVCSDWLWERTDILVSSVRPRVARLLDQ